MANSVDTDQTGPREQSDLGLHRLLRPFFPIFSIWVWMVIMRFKLILVLQNKTHYEVQIKVTDKFRSRSQIYYLTFMMGKQQLKRAVLSSNSAC